MSGRRAAVVTVLALLAVVAVYVTAFVLDTTKDRPDTLDVEPVRSTAAAACTRLRTDLDALPPLATDAPAAARQERLAVQDRAITALVAQVRAVGRAALDADVPAEQWLGDWQALAAARQAYAAGGATGPFTPPLDDQGRPVTDRMGRVGVDACVVPRSLTLAP